MGKFWGKLLLIVGIASQLLPVLGIGVPLRAIFGEGQAAAGILASLIGGFLVGMGSVKKRPVLVPATKVPFPNTMKPSPLVRPTPRVAPRLASRPSSPVKRQVDHAAVKAEFSVVLVAAGPRKIEVVREVRALTGLNLRDVMDLIEGAPRPIKEKLSKTDATEIKTRLSALGATVRLK
jgi:large subunit ribosomal protein L7/L12